MVKAGSGGYSPLQNKAYKRDLKKARDTGSTVDQVRQSGSSSSSSYGGGGRDTSPMAERGSNRDKEEKPQSVDNHLSGINEKIRNVGPALSQAIHKSTRSNPDWMERADQDIARATQAGNREGQKIDYSDLSGISRRIYEGSQYIKTNIRKGAPQLTDALNSLAAAEMNTGTYQNKKQRGPALTAAMKNQKVTGKTRVGAGDIIGYPVESTARMVEFGGMIPAGVEVMARQPGIIKPALTKGAYDATIGTGKALKEDPLQTSSDLLTGALLTGGAIKAGGKVLPRVPKARIVELEGGGANPSLKPIEYGRTLTIGNKPIVSRAGGKFQRGAAAIPDELIGNKQVTAFDPFETATFKKTVGKIDPMEAEFFGSGRKLASNIYKQRKPIENPKNFRVMSEDIPTRARPGVESTIKGYKGDIDVYGSVTQKLQMGERFSRKPQDIEVMVDNPQRFLSGLETNLRGQKYRIKDPFSDKPKVMFEEGGTWNKGIEIFSKSGKPETGKGGYTPASDIAYGFKSKGTRKVQGVDILKLEEQGARKLEGGHVFQGRKIQPKHSGRVKDIRDMAEIGAGYASKGKIKPETVLDYTRQAARRFPEIKDSPIVEYMVKKGRVPGSKEYAQLFGKAGRKATKVRDPLYSSRARSSSLRGFGKSLPIRESVIGSSMARSSPRWSSEFGSMPSYIGEFGSSPRSSPFSSPKKSSPVKSSPIQSSPRKSTPTASSPFTSSPKGSSPFSSPTSSGLFGSESSIFGDPVGTKPTNPFKPDKKRKGAAARRMFRDQLIDPIEVSTKVKSFDEIIGGKKTKSKRRKKRGK